MKFLETAHYDWMEMLNFYERPFRAKLIPSRVWRDLDCYRNDSVGLSNYCKKWRTKVEFVKEPTKAKVWKKYIGVGGEYDPENRQCVMFVHCLNFNYHEFTESAWTRFKFRFIQTLMHEMIHFMQYDRRDDEYSNYVVPYKRVGHVKRDAERRYLSEFDEIQAYAHCVYLDYKANVPSLPVETLISRCRKQDSSTLNYFLRTFNYDYKNNQAIPKIVQQILKWDKKYQKITK
jgi:hypothetical protein